jgi:hypothetical protein
VVSETDPYDRVLDFLDRNYIYYILYMYIVYMLFMYSFSTVLVFEEMFK